MANRLAIWLRCFAIVAVGLAAGASSAQTAQWQFEHHDDGSFFTGIIMPAGQRDLMLLCGEKSPQGLSAYQTGNTEPDITPRDSLRLYLGKDLIGAHDGVTQTRQDVMLVVGERGYRLPAVNWNDLFYTWEADLPVNDPVFSDIAGHDTFELRSNAGSQIITARGFGAAHGSLIQHCQTMFAAIGKHWSTAVSAAPPQVSLKQIAQAAVRNGCGGPAQMGEGTFLHGDIDGDKSDDTVVFWGEITCSGGYPRPFCGAALCTVQVFLSSQYARVADSIDLLAIDVRLQPLSNGNMGVATIGNLASCQNRPNCEFIWYWNGYEFAKLP